MQSTTWQRHAHRLGHSYQSFQHSWASHSGLPRSYGTGETQLQGNQCLVPQTLPAASSLPLGSASENETCVCVSNGLKTRLNMPLPRVRGFDVFSSTSSEAQRGRPNVDGRAINMCQGHPDRFDYDLLSLFVISFVWRSSKLICLTAVHEYVHPITVCTATHKLEVLA